MIETDVECGKRGVRAWIVILADIRRSIDNVREQPEQGPREITLRS